MNYKKSQTIDMHLQRISYYITYVDCFARIITEFIENGDGNIQPNDIPNLCEMLTKYALRLKVNILQLKQDWEFYN